MKTFCELVKGGDNEYALTIETEADATTLTMILKSESFKQFIEFLKAADENLISAITLDAEEYTTTIVAEEF